MPRAFLKERIDALLPHQDPMTGAPIDFGDPKGEYSAIFESAGIADLSPFDRLTILGKDRAKFLGNLCTNEIVKRPVGEGCEAFFLNPKGKTVDFGVIYVAENALWLDLEPGRAPEMIAHLDRFIFRDDVKLADCSESHAQFHLVGPDAAKVLSGLVEAKLVPSEPLKIVSGSIAGVPVQIRRRDRTVSPGFDLVMEGAGALTVWDTVVAAGREFQIRPIGGWALETARIEAGLPTYGRDVTQDNLPQELGRDSQAISFTKGCYIGQETVARLDAYGHVNKLLRGLVASSDARLQPGQAVSHAGKAIGSIGSSCVSPRFGKPIALAVLRVAQVPPGTTVTVETPEGPVDAVVSELPFSESS